MALVQPEEVATGQRYPSVRPPASSETSVAGPAPVGQQSAPLSAVGRQAAVAKVNAGCARRPPVLSAIGERQGNNGLWVVECLLLKRLY